MKTQQEIETRLETFRQDEEKAEAALRRYVRNDAILAIERGARYLQDVRLKIEVLEWVLDKDGLSKRKRKRKAEDDSLPPAQGSQVGALGGSRQ